MAELIDGHDCAGRVLVEPLTTPDGRRVVLFRVVGLDGAQLLRALEQDSALAAELARRVAEVRGG